MEYSKKDGLTFSWLASILIMIVGSLLAVLISVALASQKGQDEKITDNATAISTTQTEQAKQTALLIVVAEKVGVSPTEVNQLLGR